MKVVYTYLDYTNLGSIHIDTLFCGIFSAIKSNELYGNSTFIGPTELIDKLKKLDLPFTSYEELQRPLTGIQQTYLPKLYSYIQQDSPYIHLDLDLILFDKISEPENYSVRFTHQDLEEDFNFGNIRGLFKAYLEPAYLTDLKVDKEILNGVHLSHIPNMGIVQVKDIQLMKKATENALKIYYTNKEYFDNPQNMQSGCFLEQLLIPKFCRELDLLYYNSVIEKTNFIFDKPTLLFPKEINSKFIVEDQYNQMTFSFNSIKELLTDYNFDNLKVAHFLGGSKYSAVTQLLVIHNLVKYMSIESLETIHSRFSSELNLNIEQYKKLF